MSSLKLIEISATNLPDAWHQCVFAVIATDDDSKELVNARKRLVNQGSYEGEYRLEFDYITVQVKHPDARPLLPEIPPHLGIPNPVESMDYAERYCTRYLMSDIKENDEQYTYGERITSGLLQPIAHIAKDHTFLDGFEGAIVNQMEQVINRYKKHGPGNNQLIMQVGQPADIMLKDPPCLRHIDTRIEDEKLHFIFYFRSWDLWSGFPANMAAIQLMKEYMASEIGVEDGEIICSSKGLHLYGYTWEIAGKRRGITEKEMQLLLKELK